MPILISSHADLTKVTFQLELPTARLESFRLQPAAPSVASAVSTPQSTNRARVEVTALPNQILPSDTPLAQLHFVADQSNQSAALAFGVSDVVATRSNGQVLENATASGGRLFLVGTQPVLDAQNLNGQRQLVLYAPPIHSYEIQFRTNVVAGADWAKFTTVLANSAATVIVDSGPRRRPSLLSRGAGLDGPYFCYHSEWSNSHVRPLWRSWEDLPLAIARPIGSADLERRADFHAHQPSPDAR